MAFTESDFSYMPADEREMAALQVNAGIQDACHSTVNQNDDIPEYNESIADAMFQMFTAQSK